MKLTLPQQDIYFEQILFPNEPIYNIGAKILIKGALDQKALDRAYTTLIQQHDAYRCIFKGQINPTGFIISEVRSLEFIDFSDEKKRSRLISNYINREFRKTFDIKKDDFLYRFILIKVTEKFHYLFSVFHHIITDGWGASLMFQRLINNYNEILKYGTVQTKYPYSYENFIIEDKKYFNSNEFQDDKDYWVKSFAILPENIFPKISPCLQINKSSRKRWIIRRDIYNKLIQLAANNNSTVFHIILAVLCIYLGKRYQSEALSFGLPVLNRSGIRFKNTVGLFMGMNILMIAIDDEETFVELVGKIKNQLRNNYRHQRFPLRQLIKELGIIDQKERLFNITLSYEKHDYSGSFLNTNTRVSPLSHRAERVALSFYIREFDNISNVKIDIDYNVNYFTKKDIDSVVEHLKVLLNKVIISPQKRLKEFNYLRNSERHQILKEFNNTNSEYPRNETTIDLFEEQVLKTPNNIAVMDSKVRLTYQELKEKSDKIALYLVSNYGSSKEPVGVLVNRSTELIILLLGIFKSGRYYIPLDLTLPNERIEYIIKHSRVQLVIIEDYSLEERSRFSSVFKNNRLQTTMIFKKDLLNFNSKNRYVKKNKLLPEDSAYVIYTSGSTGIPKGVEIRNQSLTNLLISVKDMPGINEQDILYSVTPSSFDISILEFFSPLITGGTVFIAEKKTLNNIELLKNELRQVNPSIIQATPSFYQMLINAGWKGNKNLKILCGGDSLNAVLVKKLITCGKEVWNMYGPTETTIWSSTKRIECISDTSNIGKPINNTRIYIVDKNHNILPKGTVGRIFIAGDGLAKGYYRDEKLTRERFINNPFEKGAKMYETGDIGRWNNKGEIEFLGRKDLQVKIRGFRIELGEIEAHLSQYKNIRQVVAEAKEVNGDKVLVAYYTKDIENTIDKTDLRHYLQNKLPEYMVPGFYIELESIPLTPNGKIDHKALPSVTETDIIRKEYVAPRNEIEQKLVQVWREVLGIKKVGITDNFFELGGNSLGGAKIVNKISHFANKKISLKDIFENSTIEELVHFMNDKIKNKEVIPQARIKEYYHTTYDQKKIWIATQKEKLGHLYNIYAVFKIEGELNQDLLERTLSKIIKENEILRTNFIEKGGEIYQIIKEPQLFKIDRIETTSECSINCLIKDYVSQQIDMENGNLIKTAIIKNKKGKKFLVFLTHHIIVDGMSLEILLNGLVRIYNNPKISNIPKIQFKDYSEWLQNSIIENENDFWGPYLRILKKTSFVSNGNSINHGFIKQKTLYFSTREYHNLKEISKKNKVTSYITILTSIGIVLSKMYKQNNICIGTVFSGRNYKQIEDSIGMFIKTVPYHLLVEKTLGFSSLVKKTQDTFLLLEKYSNFPFSTNLNMLTDFLIVYQHSNSLVKTKIDFGKFSLKRIATQYAKSRIPLVFNFYDINGLTCEIDYDESINENTWGTIWEKMQILLNIIIGDSNKTIEELDLYTSKETHLRNITDVSFDF